MKTKFHKLRWAVLAAGLLMSVHPARSQDNGKKPSSYAPVDIHESFSTIQSRMTAAKPEIMKRHMALLEQRYDLSNRVSSLCHIRIIPRAACFSLSSKSTR